MTIDQEQRMGASEQAVKTPVKAFPSEIGICPPSPWERDIMEQNQRFYAERRGREVLTNRILDSILSEKKVAVKQELISRQNSASNGASSPTENDWNELDQEEPTVRKAIIAGWQDLEAALA